MTTKLTFTLLYDVEAPAVRLWFHRHLWTGMKPHSLGGYALDGSERRYSPVLRNGKERNRKGYLVVDADDFNHQKTMDIFDRASQHGAKSFGGIVEFNDFLYHTGQRLDPDGDVQINVLVGERQKDVVLLKILL